MKSLLHGTTGPLYAENDGNPAGGTPPPPDAGANNNTVDLTKMLEQISNNLNKSMSDLRKDMNDRLTDNNAKFKLMVDDIMEVTSNQPRSIPVPPLPVSAPATATAVNESNSTSSANVEDAIRMATIATRRKLEAEQDARKVLEQQVVELTRDNRQTRIESSINSAMSKLQWAESTVSELVASQMIQKAEIDADGKVKIGGADPANYIKDYWTNARWAQPAPANSGSGNAGTTVRRNDGTIDLSNYDPAKMDPKSDDFRKLIEQTKRSSGMST